MNLLKIAFFYQICLEFTKMLLPLQCLNPGNGMNENRLTSLARRTLVRLLPFAMIALSVATARAQDISLKTNLLYWSTTTPNLGAEMRLGRKTSAQVFFGLNPWKQSGGNHSSLRHWLLMPEWRYWFCQPFNGWFVGVHGLGGEYNAGGVDLPFNLIHTLEDHRYKGWYIGGGVTGGYQWALSKHWALEANIGLGYIYSPNDRHCTYCEGVQRHKKRHYVGPTKAALSIAYVFAGKEKRAQALGVPSPQLATLAVTNPAQDDAPAADPIARMSGHVKLMEAQTTPEANRMNVRLLLNLDSLRLKSSQQLVYTPVLHTPDSTYTLPEIVINGRGEHVLYRRGVFKKEFSPEVLEVRRKNGTPQTISYLAQLPLKDAANVSYKLELREDNCGCGTPETDNVYAVLTETPKPVEPKKVIELPDIAFVQPAVTGKPKIYELDKRAYIDFPVDRIELYPDYRRNPEQLDSIINTINILKADPNLTVTNITIHGYASPESPYTHNAWLAENRAKTLTDYVRRMVDLPQSLFAVTSTPEDWEGLINYLKANDIPNRDAILAIAQDESLKPDPREAKIKRLYPEQYQYMLKNWYPALRHSDYHIVYIVKPFDLEEARQIIKRQPQYLSLNEMWMVAQTYKPGTDAFNEVMEIAVRYYPNDPTANLNAAIERLNRGDADAAKPYLDKAGTSPEAINARAAYDKLKAAQAQQ